MFKLFFENLSERLFNENNLSDITYAMCNTSTVFQDAFLKFFFKDMVISEDVEIGREFTKGDYRVDFHIINNGETFLIENKIWNQKQHFEEYDDEFNVPPERFGYIANYPISQEKHYQIRTWEDFYKKLKTLKGDDDIEQSLIDGYREYLKKVCNIIDFERPMNIEGIYSLYELIETLTKLCKRQEEHFTLDYPKSSRIFNSHVDHHKMGIDFQLDYSKGSGIKTSKGWIGIYFDLEQPEICIGFWDRDGWGKPICDIIRMAGKIKQGNLHSESFEEADAYWFDFIDDKDTYEEYFNKLSLDEQTEMLKSFMDGVLNDIFKCYNEQIQEQS